MADAAVERGQEEAQGKEAMKRPMVNAITIAYFSEPIQDSEKAGNLERSSPDPYQGVPQAT